LAGAGDRRAGAAAFAACLLGLKDLPAEMGGTGEAVAE
jgi:hypothetical protein